LVDFLPLGLPFVGVFPTEPWLVLMTAGPVEAAGFVRTMVDYTEDVYGGEGEIGEYRPAGV